jgi:hypothetical protein
MGVISSPTEVTYKDYIEWLNGYPLEYYDHWIVGHTAHQFDDCGKTDCWYCIVWRKIEDEQTEQDRQRNNLITESILALSSRPNDEKR